MFSIPRLSDISITVVATVLIWGCVGSPTIETMCQTDADCQAGLQCHSGRACVTRPEQAHDVLLRIAPPLGSGLVQEHFSASLSPEPDMYGQTWQLSKPAAVRGTIVRAQDPFHSSIPGTLIATAPGQLNGVQLRYQTTSYSTPRVFEGSNEAFGFELLLQVGPAYEITFWPDSPDIPPYTSTLKVGGDTDGWMLELPADGELVTVTGALVTSADARAGCDSSCVGCVGVKGLRVVLVDGSGHVCSSRAVTDDAGAFSVQVQPSVDKAELRFSPSGSLKPLPTGRLSQWVDLTMAWKKKQHQITLGQLNLGAIEQLVDRNILVQDVEGNPVGGAQVIGSATLSSPSQCADQTQPLFSELKVAVSSPTDIEGKVSLALPQGSVEVQVKPAMGHIAANWSGLLTVEKTIALNIVCEKRALLTGKILDFEGIPVGQATIRFTSLADLKLSPVETQALADGSFEVRLDGGDWAVVIEPPEGRGLARYSKHLVNVDLLYEPLPLQVVLPAPTVMMGTVINRDGEPMVGVVVDVIAQSMAALSTKELASAPESMDRALLVHEMHLLGTSFTSEDGRFEVLVETSQLAH